MKKNKQSIVTTRVFVCALLAINCNTQNSKSDQVPDKDNIQTICNPININYRYMKNEPSRRESGDPHVVLYKDDYYLFASFAGGYWWSNDLTRWTFVETNEIIGPIASTAVVIGEDLYYLASMPVGDKPVFKAIDPKNGKWSIPDSLGLKFRLWDPDFLYDDDERLYLYWGCSPNSEPIHGIELDHKNGFKFIGKPVELFWGYPKKHGWEQKGENNEDTTKVPWIEGPTMTKHDGLYYLQYAAPGTELTTYADGVYVSDKPLGPFRYQKHNPISYKPGGYNKGVGHGCTFQDKNINYWHISTQIICDKHMTERRLGIHPAFFDKDSIMYTSTRFGDYPMIIPDRKIEKPEEVFPQWMLLSYNRPVETSSAIDSLPAENIVDENIKTYWAAKSGNKGEWAMIDLEEEYTVNAVQLNYFDYQTGVTNRDSSVVYIQYLLEASVNEENWTVLADKRNNQTDIPHDYIQFEKPQKFRYLKLTNHHIPGGHFALSGIRVFGKGNGKKPLTVSGLQVKRNEDDRRMATITWQEVNEADGYNILFGIAPDKLYNTVQLGEVNSRVLRSLNLDHSYYFAIEAFNKNGISEISEIKTIP